MDTFMKVEITCSLAELRNNEPFVRAAEFGMHDSHIDITCRDTRQVKTYNCSSLRAHCYGWRHFKDEWERQFGRLNP